MIGMKFQWEQIAEDTRRARVFGGWIVQNLLFKEGERGVFMSESSVFIPDLKHEWSIK
jgi:hypothetical protein